MAITVANVITAVRQVFDEISDAEVITHANTVDRDLSSRIKLRRTLTDVSLTASDDEYVLAEEILRIWAARYVRSSTRADQYPLKEISREEMNEFMRSHRNAPNEEPKYYYIDVDENGDSVIGLWPIPPTTTSGGYPKVVVECSRSATLSGGSSLPSKVKNVRAYKAGICYYYALEKRKSEAAFWEDQYRKAVLEEEQLEFGRLVQYRQRYRSNFLPRGGMV